MRYLFGLSLAAATAYAQQTLYGQCGGIGWKGATTCVAGSVCIVSNPYYSQCLPGTVSTLKTSTTSVAVSTKAPPPPVTSSSKAPTSPTSSKPVSSPSPPPVSGGSIAKVSGNLFNIDGTTKYFAGTNSYWIGFLTNNADVDLVMSHLQTSGLKVLRVWGFNDVSSVPGAGQVYFQSFVSGQSPAINTGAYGLQRLDYVVSSAAAHGIKLIVNFVNNWSDYGGIPLQMKYYGLTTQDQWFTSAAAQANYQTYIKAVVSRYAGNTAIFAWELANEIRCQSCADTTLIYKWATTTSAYIKSIDSQHMVTMGDEGFGLGGGPANDYQYSLGPGYNFTQNLMIPNIDFGTFHAYPGSWSETNDWTNKWITDHAAACLAVGKPCIMEEYGTSTNHVASEGPWQTTALSVSGKGLAGDMIWQWGDTISSGQTANDGYTVYYQSADWTGLVQQHVAAIK
ncbi:hypothetical protein MMC25_007228 [Agyrium rufum]|nr:hypothetical protein [Agyrium rufum]